MKEKKKELIKLATFGLITSLLTSAYATFLGTIMRQGFGTEGFVKNWLSLIPKAYIALIPFILITGPFIRKFSNKMVDKICPVK